MTRRIDPALVVVLAGISAALHVGKLPPALPVLRDALQISLVQAGFLLSLVQLAGMTLGVAIGAAADSLGPRRTMVLGLLILAVASFAGGFVQTPGALMALRAAEGAGFLLATLPAPGLIRRLVEPQRLAATLGLWGAFMPIGTAAALLAGPACIALAGWPGWWWLLALLALVMAVVLALAVPSSADARMAAAAGAGRRIMRTIRAKGPWLPSLAFAVYSAQWLTVVGFLPTIYAQAGLPTAYAAFATAFAALVNMTGNIASGRFLQRGVPAPVLLFVGYAAMLVGAVVAFSPAFDSAVLRYLGVLLFSSLGGLVPGTLFSVAVRVAPDDTTVSSTVGWVQQLSAFGQFVGPPFAAWVAARMGGWHVIWWVTGAFALAGMGMAHAISRFLAGHADAPPAVPHPRP
ncbi:MFS transporter [Ramlibacter sp. USB13]|uniref:MFS transporter n=1 Tax=Ramlibacter cellulosilyticus TaxID=2764187 RepID=A0A923MTV5_9BURK|nr:MFS transporter [Ramlibacter cellulosilyticus]MBC5784544.1 MFS transporter [Ramlibacter cellulosilyticus]